MSPAKRIIARASQTRPRVQVWPQASQRLGHAPQDVQWIRVADREADIYEYLVSCQALGHGFVIRAAKDRALSHPETGKRAGRLFCGTQRRPPRRVYIRVTPKAATPRAHGALVRECHRRDVECSLASRIWAEQKCPYPMHRRARLGGRCSRRWDKLEWILLCNAEVVDFAQARECALQYSTRWVIEEYHKAIKTGLGAERLQLESAERLFAAVAIMSVVALRLIELRERLRRHPEAEAAQAGLESSGTGGLVPEVRPHAPYCTRGGLGHRALGWASQSDQRWLAGMANALAWDEHLARLS